MTVTTALLYDIHGNLPALKAVLEDARRAGAGRFVLGGDYAAFGAWPKGTVELLKQLDHAAWIRGNVDRWTVDPSDSPDQVRAALHACRELLGDDLAEELAALPETLGRDGTLYCHASPGSDTASFLPEPGDSDRDLLQGVTQRRLVFGHTHLQFTRTTPEGVELVNPGSVGMPLDGDTRAAYALLIEDGAIKPRRVAYDHDASAAAVRSRLGSEGELLARRIERARFDVG